MSRRGVAAGQGILIIAKVIKSIYVLYYERNRLNLVKAAQTRGRIAAAGLQLEGHHENSADSISCR
jgi:hypothetical protein